MSFIKIIEEKNPIEMHNKVYEASKNNALTPEFCMEVLGHTNVSVIKGEMLEVIGKLPIEEQKQYKKAILSMFDGRQTSEKVKNKALELAKNNGFVSELVDIIDNTGNLGYPARVGCDKIYVIEKGGNYRDVDFSLYENVIVKGEIEDEINFVGNNSLKGVLDLRGTKKVYLIGRNLSKVSKIIFGEGAEVSLSKATNLPKDLDVSMFEEVDLSCCDLRGINLKFREGAKVYLTGATNLPHDLDVSMCDWVALDKCNLEGINLKFREGGRVYLADATNLPHDLDVSMCDEVNLSWCDMEGNNLKFKEGARVYLCGVENLSKDLDVSMCDKVDLGKCFLEGVNLKFKEGAKVYYVEGLNLKFKEGASVSLSEAKNLPMNLDVSMCDEVDLGGCDLEGINLKFREGAKVYLGKAKNLSKDLDVSMCNEVNMTGANVSNVKELKFKNEEQMRKSKVKIPEDWKGKIIYTDDEKQMPVIFKGNDGR